MDKNWYAIECWWTDLDEETNAYKNDNNYWEGKLIVEENGFAHGLVKGKEKGAYTHYLTGTFDEKIGFELIKLDIKNGASEPIRLMSYQMESDFKRLGEYCSFKPFNMKFEGYFMLRDYKDEPDTYFENLTKVIERRLKKQFYYAELIENFTENHAFTLEKLKLFGEDLDKTTCKNPFATDGLNL